LVIEHGQDVQFTLSSLTLVSEENCKN